MIQSRELANTLYWGCYCIGFIAIFIFNTIYGKKYNIKPLKALAFSIISYAFIFGWSYILAWIMNGFSWGHHNAIRVYIWFPVVLMLTGKLFRIPWIHCCEYMTPSTCIVYGIARIGCIFTGCCYGYEFSLGIYSKLCGYNCFPVQLCEAITSLIIALFIIRKAHKKNYATDSNNLYPLMLIVYGGTRTIWEFFADNHKIIFGLSELQIWALVTCLIGCFWYSNRKKVDEYIKNILLNQRRTLQKN